MPVFVLCRFHLYFLAYKETAFLYAITSASLVYAFAKACSRGQLSFCSCDYQFNQPWHTASWRWGGCGDNVQAAEAIVAQFVLAAKYSWEGRIKSVDGHNFAVGVKVRSTEMVFLLVAAIRCSPHGRIPHGPPRAFTWLFVMLKREEGALLNNRGCVVLLLLATVAHRECFRVALCMLHEGCKPTKIRQSGTQFLISSNFEMG